MARIKMINPENKPSIRDIVRIAFVDGIDRHEIPEVYKKYGITEQSVRFEISRARPRGEETYDRISSGSHYIILPNGRGIPYMKGVSQSEEHVRKKAGARRGKGMPESAVLERMTVWLTAKRLVERGALAHEIEDLTVLSRKQAQNAINRPRLLLCDPNYEATKEERKRRSALINGRGVSDPTPGDLKSTAFARMLLSDGLIPEDCSGWRQMQNLYEKSGRILPENFAVKLRLEFFYQAVKRGREGDNSLLILYKNLGEKVDSEWFDESLAGEEDFISIFVQNDLIGLREDELGLFRIDNDGNRWRQPIASGENGGIIFDSTQQLGVRTRLRNWSSQELRREKPKS